MGTVRTEHADGVTTLTLADVDNRNALGPTLLSELSAAITAADADEATRVVVVTNDGNTFCAGANLKEQSRGGSSAGLKASGDRPVGLDQLLIQIQQAKTPVLGRIAGHVMGGGNGLVAALDIAIAADDVKFGFTEVRLGVVPAIVSVVCLPKMRPGEAMEVFLRGNRFSASRAAELGLINRAVPRGDLDAALGEVLDDLRKAGPNALGFAKALVHRVPTMTQQEAFAWTTKLSADLFRSDEAKEGMAAFLGRRPAAWVKED